MMEFCTIIGVDCATDAKNVGLARGIWREGKLRITDVSNGQFQTPEETICKWISDSESCLPHARGLLAMDAPLGWPQDLGRTLANHMAGMPLQAESNQLFRRETDRFVQRTFGKAPLDVGADRIARTALSALKLLDTLSKKTGNVIPLAWDANFTGIAAIEVYPAGTLRVSQVQSSAYKRPEQIEVRRQILQWLSKETDLPEELSLPLADADALDAMICVLAGADFLAGRAYTPTDLSLVQKEGWIWIRKLT
jgi:predicted RNase H-like nuclease